LKNWPAALIGEASTKKSVMQLMPDQDPRLRFVVQLSPWVALAEARSGDLTGRRGGNRRHAGGLL
jgi:hypothetical protein